MHALEVFHLPAPDGVRAILRVLAFESCPLLLKMFHQLSMVLYFPNLSGCKRLVVLEVQWLIDAMACLIREEEHHGSLLQELLADDDSPEGDLCRATPTGVTWRADDIRRGWFSVKLLEYIWGHEQKYKKLILDSQAIKRQLKPNDVAQLVLFLASDQSSGCTKQSFIVDGGIT